MLFPMYDSVTINMMWPLAFGLLNCPSSREISSPVLQYMYVASSVLHMP